MRRLRFLLATRNEGKVREILSALSGLPIEFDSLFEREDLPPALETGTTFQENARLKAEHYFHLTGLPTLAEDSGLVVEALGGQPGVHSARFAPTDRERIDKVLKLLGSSSTPDQRRACFVSAVCFLQPDNVIEVTGEVEGEIAREPRGDFGFGYDPIFYYPPLGKTFAEMTTEEKNQISHRACALQKLRDRLRGDN